MHIKRRDRDIKKTAVQLNGTIESLYMQSKRRKQENSEQNRKILHERLTERVDVITCTCFGVLESVLG
jgi:hypothetical protein